MFCLQNRGFRVVLRDISCGTQVQAARDIVEDPWVAGAGELDDFETTDLWPGDFTPHYRGDWREVGHTLQPGFDYYAKPDVATGLDSGSKVDWTTAAGAQFVAVVLLLHVAAAPPSLQQAEEFAKLVRARAEHDGEWAFDCSEVEGWLAGEELTA